jgi:hypothetical protein
MELNGKSQLEDVQQNQVTVTSKWARIGLFSALAGLLLVVLLFVSVLVGLAEFLLPALQYLAVLPTIAMLIALVSTIVGIVEIIAKRPDVKGWGYVAKSLAIVLLYCAALTLTLSWSFREHQEMEMREAVESGSVEEVARLLERKPKLVDIRYHREFTPLVKVIQTTGNMEMIEFLISKGADVNADCGMGDTPLHETVTYAASQDFSESSNYKPASEGIDYKAIIEYLLQKGADINRRNDPGQTPLGIAVSFDCNDIADLLRKHGGTE